MMGIPTENFLANPWSWFTKEDLILINLSAYFLLILRISMISCFCFRNSTAQWQLCISCATTLHVQLMVQKNEFSAVILIAKWSLLCLLWDVWKFEVYFKLFESSYYLQFAGASMHLLLSILLLVFNHLYTSLKGSSHLVFFYSFSPLVEYMAKGVVGWAACFLLIHSFYWLSTFLFYCICQIIIQFLVCFINLFQV